MKRSTRILLFRLFLLLILLVVASLPAYYFYHKYQESKKLLTNPSQVAQDELRLTVNKVSKLIDLPQGETPTLATVSDKDRLRDEPFFRNSENGDKVLVYSNARKAYLYRPKTNKLIDVATLGVTSKLTSQRTPSPELQKGENQVDVVLSNGTGIVSLTQTVEGELLKTLPEAKIIEKGTASSSGHLITKVIVLNSQKQKVAQQLAKDIKASLAPLPTYEVRPKSGDILVIIGKDKSAVVPKPISVTPTPSPVQ